jgi:cell shape-determining protein MreC
MRKLLVEMNDLLVEVDQIDKELADLTKQLWVPQKLVPNTFTNNSIWSMTIPC